MKVYLKSIWTCGLNYQHYLLINCLNGIEDVILTDNPNEADVVIFSGTCACTQLQILSTIEQMGEVLKDVRETTKVFMTGCLARKFIKDDVFLNKVNEWIGLNIDEVVPQNKPILILEKLFGSEFTPYVNKFGFSEYDSEEGSLYISSGCLNKCSFCKTSYQEFPLKSCDIDMVKQFIDYYDSVGISKLFLKGANLSQYGIDLYREYKLPEILEYIEGKNNIKEVGLVGFGFADAIRNNFGEVIRDCKKINYIGGSLESGSDRLLELMRKGFTSEEYVSFVNYVREKYFKNLHTTIMAGFPTETISDVRKTLDILGRLNPSFVDICRYTDSTFVDSHKYEQLAPEVIQEHARIYSKVLSKRKVKNDIKAGHYIYNNRLHEYQ